MNVVEPIIRSERAKWIRDFDKIRLLLEPWQVWFFQKRRIVRLIDKVFDNEFNLDRLEEFKNVVAGRLEAKRQTVLKNFQSSPKPDGEIAAHIASAPLDEVVEVHMFLSQDRQASDALIETLVSRSRTGSFRVLSKIFPDHPRAANDHYFAKALRYLIALGQHRETVEWLPAWLSGERQSQVHLEEPTRRLLRLCLTNFEGDEARRVVMLASAAIRRVIKMLLLTNESSWRTAEAMHFLHRYQTRELSWSQFGASPEGQLLGTLNTAARGALIRYIESCRNDRGSLNLEVAKLNIRDIWKIEAGLLNSHQNYAALLRERSLGEMYPTEHCAVTHDYLGHVTLCFPMAARWRDYIVESHQPELELLARMGSWSAKELMGYDVKQELPGLSDEVLADRFFLGDKATLIAVRDGYRWRG